MHANAEDMMTYTVFDLDGCLSDDSWRLPLIGHHPNAEDHDGYDEYQSSLHLDKFVNKHHVDRAIERGDTIIIVTARPERYRDETSKWLIKNNIPYYKLYMRREGDKDKSPEVKKKAIANFIKSHFVPIENIYAVYDDREDVIEAYKELGIQRAYLLRIHHDQSL